MITYLILANLFLAICYGFYHVFLRKETFFHWNRLFLLSGLLFAFGLPLVDTVAVWGDASAAYHVHLPAIQIGTGAVDESATLAGSPAALVSAGSPWISLAGYYWAGCLIATLIFIYKLLMTIRLLRSGKRAQSYSFFGIVHVDQSTDTQGRIAKHESVHARQLHSLDVVLLEFVKIFNWFNPFVYLYARALKLQHEYIADRETSVGGPAQYAELLLSKAFGASMPVLATSFAESSFLKRRIHMLLKAKSKKAAFAKFVLVVPMLIAMLAVSMSFSASTQERNQQDEAAVRAFKEEIGRYTRYPQAVIDEGLSAIVWAAYEKKDGQYVEITFLDDSHVDFHTSVQRTLERESTKALAPEGRNSVEIRFSVMGGTQADLPPPPPPVEPAGYTDLGQVTIIGYGPQKRDTLEKEDNIVFETVEVSPKPPGGLQAFRIWLGQNYQFPQAAIDAGINGTVEVTFIVEPDGSLADVRVLRDLGHGTGEEAVRLLKSADKWAPGIQNGRAVRVAYTLPIRIATQ